MIKNIIFIIVLFFSLQSFSQELQSEAEDQEWRIIPGIYGMNRPAWPVEEYSPYKNSDGDFKASILMLSPTEAVALVTLNGNEYGIIKINDKLKTQWRTSLRGVPHRVLKFHDNLLVLAAAERRGDAAIAYLLNPQNGKIIKQAAIFEKLADPADKDVTIKALQNTASSDVKFAVRYSDKKAPDLTLGLNIVSFNDDLEITSTDKIPLGTTGQFVNCALNSRGDLIFLSAEDNNQFKAQSFRAKTWIPQKKLFFSFQPRKKSRFLADLYLSELNPDVAFVYIDYKNEEKDDIRAIHKLDFENEKVFSYEKTLNKDFIKEAKSGFEVINKKIDKPDYGDWDKMKVIDIIDNGESVLVAQEVRYSYDSPSPNSLRTYWTTGDGLLVLLDKNMKPVSQTIIPKRFRINVPVGVSSSIHIRDNKILWLSGYDKGSGRTAIYARIDIQTGKLEKIEELTKKDIKGRYPADPQATLWFKNNFILSYLDSDAVMLRITRMQANLQNFSY